MKSPQYHRHTKPKVIASVVVRAQALPDQPPPTPVPIVIPPLPITGERDKPQWPRNENEIDLPADPPPSNRAAIDEPVYLGTVNTQLRHDIGPMSIDVRIPTDLSRVELGPMLLAPDQARRLWRLLRVAVSILDYGHPTPEEIPHAG